MLTNAFNFHTQLVLVQLLRGLIVKLTVALRTYFLIRHYKIIIYVNTLRAPFPQLSVVRLLQLLLWIKLHLLNGHAY